MNNEIKIITKMIKQISDRLEKYNKRVNTMIKQKNYPIGITYDQLSRDIIKISGDEYKKEIKIERIE